MSFAQSQPAYYKYPPVPSVPLTYEMSTLQQQRLIVEQLRREAAIRRINVSQAVEEIKKFVQDHQRDDCLIYGFHPPKSNPFREKSSCNVL